MDAQKCDFIVSPALSIYGVGGSLLKIIERAGSQFSVCIHRQVGEAGVTLVLLSAISALIKF